MKSNLLFQENYISQYELEKECKFKLIHSIQFKVIIYQNIQKVD